MNEDRADLERLFDPVTKPDEVGALEGSIQRETKSRPRVTVSIVRCSTRELDPDNLVGSVKAIVDCLRYAGLITNDTEAQIALDVSQMHVNTRKEHQTRIILEYEDK